MRNKIINALSVSAASAGTVIAALGLVYASETLSSSELLNNYEAAMLNTVTAMLISLNADKLYNSLSRRTSSLLSSYSIYGQSRASAAMPSQSADIEDQLSRESTDEPEDEDSSGNELSDLKNQLDIVEYAIEIYQGKDNKEYLRLLTTKDKLLEKIEEHESQSSYLYTP